MKILLMSDSHGNIENMRKAVIEEKPDQILHMGDHDRDLAAIRREFPLIPARAVKGNCDAFSNEEPEALLRLGGKKIFITHGHEYRVKTTEDLVVQEAVCQGADVVVFGHTHIPMFTTFSGIYVINPGSIGFSGRYGVLEILGGDMVYKAGRIVD